MGDVGRINQAFTSEYAPTSPLVTSVRSPKSPGSFFNNNNNNFAHPSNTAPGFHRQQSQQRRRPPAPLSSTETRFAFPPPAPTSVNSGRRITQSTLSSFPSNDGSAVSSSGGLSPPFTLERPPSARRKKPAPDPPSNLGCSGSSSSKNIDAQGLSSQKPPTPFLGQTSESTLVYVFK